MPTKISAGSASNRQKRHTRRMAELPRRAFLSEPIFLDAAIERGSAQAQRLGGLGDVAVAAAQNLADEQGFHLVDAHVLKRGSGGARGGDGQGPRRSHGPA